MSVPTEANQIVLQHLDAAKGPITLGLLPLTSAQEEKCICDVVNYCDGRIQRLFSLIGILAPAAATYAIAAGASQSVSQGGAFWEPLSNRLNIPFTNPSDRERLAGIFTTACRRLGVIDPDVSSMAWKNVAPMMAQASILHNWAEALGQGVQTTMNRHPLPDLEDSLALCKFAALLADHIHNQPNLRKILQTEVGGVVVHRLISSCVYGRFEILPSHLIQPMKEALESSGRQVSLKSPYVSFSTVHAGFELVLPKQPGSLTSQRTYWLVNGVQYSPQSERHLSEFEIGRGKHEIQLRNLAGGYADQSFTAELLLEKSFRVFDANTLREKSAIVGKTTELLAGKYLIVMKAGASSNDAEAEEVRGDYRILPEISLRPGMEPLLINHDGMESILTPALKAGIYYSAEGGSSSILEGGLRLHFGETFNFLAYIPKEQHSGILEIAITSRESKLHESEMPLSDTVGGVYDYSSVLESALCEAVKLLAPGIHPLRIKISTHTAVVLRDLWYWKSLDEIRTHSGFHCAMPPTNIDYARSKGIVPSVTGCGLAKGYRAPRITIILQSGESISLMRPGVSAVCIDPEYGDFTELVGSETLTVSDKDTRVIAFESGGFEDWSILCNGTEFATLEKSRVRYQIGLRSLLADYGKSGRVDARNSRGESFRIFGFTSSLIAKRLDLKLDHGRAMEVWKTSVPSEDIGRLGIRVLDYSESPDPIINDVVVIFDENETAQDTTQNKPIAIGISTQVKYVEASDTSPNRLKVSVNISPSECSSKLQMVDLMRAPEGSDDWQPLYCADGPQTSLLRIVASGEMQFDETKFTWWHHLWRVSQIHAEAKNLSLYEELGEKEIGAALNQISQMLAAKYPTSVYLHSAKYLTSLSHKLSTRRESLGKRDTNIWWRESAKELEEYAVASVTPVVRQFLLSCNPHVLRRRWENISCDEESSVTGISPSLLLGSAVARAGGRVPYAQKMFAEKKHPDELFGSFANSPTVFRGQAADFHNFDFQKFFKPIFTSVIQFDECAADLDDASLLSAKHLLKCIKAMNRRVRVIANASNSEDPDHPLRNALHGLSEVNQYCCNLLPSLKTVINYRPWTDYTNLERPDQFDVPDAPSLPLIKNEQASQINTVTWTLCVLSRATAHRLISNEDFTLRIKGFCGTNIQSHPINLILSLAPELFAYYIALLDFALFTPDKNKSI